MNSSSISKEMLDNFTQLNEEEKISVLELVNTFLKSRKDDLKPQSLEEYNRELDRANDEIEAGDYIGHENLMTRLFQVPDKN